MTAAHQAATDSGAAAVIKLAPPATVSISTIAGYPVSEILFWATLVYTALMIGHKMIAIWRDLTRKDQKETEP